MADTRSPHASLLSLDTPAVHAMLAEEIGLRYNYASNLTASVLRQHSVADQKSMLVCCHLI